MKKTENNTSFLDLLLILVVMFAAMLILALPFLNPIADEGKIDPAGLVMITLRWPDGSIKDMDIWIKGPDGRVVSYQNKDSGAGVFLDRDDLGSANDTIIVDGVAKIIPRNLETVMITNLADGEYIVNVHHFSGTDGAVTVTVEVVGLMPYRIWYSGDAMLSSRQELTIVSFTVKGGRITDVRTDLQIRLRASGGSVP